MDAIIIVGDCLSKIKRIKEVLNCSFKIKDLRKLKYFLGLEVARLNKGIHLCQRNYILDILTGTGMISSEPCTTPLMTNNNIIFKDA